MWYTYDYLLLFWTELPTCSRDLCMYCVTGNVIQLYFITSFRRWHASYWSDSSEWSRFLRQDWICHFTFWTWGRWFFSQALTMVELDGYTLYMYILCIYSIPVFATRLTPLLANKLDLSFFSTSSFLAICFFHLAMSSSERQSNETIEPTVEADSAVFFFKPLKLLKWTDTNCNAPPPKN